MNDQILMIIRDACLFAGGFAVLVGNIGILRFPEFFSRVHAAGVTETAGIGFIIAGLMIQAGLSLISLKLLIILALVLLTSPTASHALAKAAIHTGLSPLAPNKGEKPSN